MKLFTIGFTKKSAQEFFELIQKSGVTRVVDIRLNNTSQIAGFAKSRDLKYFLNAIANVDYIHVPALAPTQDILDQYKKKKGEWTDFKASFLQLMEIRNTATAMLGTVQDWDCLLCSEHTYQNCHRSLVVDHLNRHWQNLEVHHL